MNRRIVNELLTTYLPTVFILGIVYATNFFKSFFFEAQVTVNLTSLLVLTTLFISVSKSLPPTAYVKMIDIWLIFAQLIPFAEVQGFICIINCTAILNNNFQVMLHTFMECLKDDDNREVNHHGSLMTIDEKGNKVFKMTKNKRMADRGKDQRFFFSAMPSFTVDYLKMSQFAAKTGIPIVIAAFSAVYWSYGLFFYFYPAL